MLLLLGLVTPDPRMLNTPLVPEVPPAMFPSWPPKVKLLTFKVPPTSTRPWMSELSWVMLPVVITLKAATEVRSARARPAVDPRTASERRGANRAIRERRRFMEFQASYKDGTIR